MEKDREKKKLYRKMMSEEKRRQYNEAAKERMKTYREAQKIKRKKMTTSQKQQERRRWREAKRRQRAAMTPEMKKQSEMRQLKKRLKKLSPTEFADIFDVATPRKQRELAKRGVETSGQHKRSSVRAKNLYSKFQKQVNTLKGKRDHSSRMKLKILVSHMYNERVNLKVCWRTLQKYSMINEEIEIEELERRKSKSDALSPDVQKKARDFYKDNATSVPLKRFAQRQVLSDSTKLLHSKFLAENKGTSVSLSSFRRLRPSGVLTVDKNKFISCLCEYCLNVDYKVKDYFVNCKILAVCLYGNYFAMCIILLSDKRRYFVSKALGALLNIPS